MVFIIPLSGKERRDEMRKLGEGRIKRELTIRAGKDKSTLFISQHM